MKKLYSLIATLLAFSIILSMFTMSFVTASAVSTDVWNGKTATEFAGGDGTQANPYRIENGAQLAKAIADKGLKDGATGTYYLIVNDIYLNEDYENYADWANTAPENKWSPITNDFMGHLDGGYHTIYGLYTIRNHWFNGLIPSVGTNATVSNLIVTNSYVASTTSDSKVGTIIGQMKDNSKISNCLVYDSAVAGVDCSGGVTGVLKKYVIIENCGSYNLTLTGTYRGGIVANPQSYYATIKNCYSGGYKPHATRSDLLKFSNTYTDASNVPANTATLLETAQMQGTGAVATMGLSTSIWKDTDGYPTLVGNGTKGETWRGGKAAWYAGGKGTAAHPFLIETGEQLYKAIADKGMYAGAGVHYLITADIYLNSDYENYADWANAENAPANNWGTVYSSNSFSGYLDGGYHTIYGMYYKASGSYAGLVPYLSGSGAAICNLIVTNSYVNNSGGDSSAIFAGRMDNGTILNCIAHDSYITNSKNSVMAGIVAYTANGSVNSYVKNCGVYDLTFSEDATYVGGMVGKGTWPTYLNGCYSGGTYILGQTGGSSCAASHTDVAGSANGVTHWSATPEKMQGAEAVTNMGLSTAIWKTTDGYPVFALNNGTEGETWTGVKANSYNGGAGTEDDPYLIATAEQLYKALCDLGKDSSGNALYYSIVSDIYLNDNYENYADWANAENAPANNWLPTDGDFIGHLDGGLHTVYGLYSLTGAWRNGLIRRIKDGATVENVTVAYAYVRNNSAVAGGIVGIMYENTKVSNCIVHDASISANSTEAAGIVAKANKNTTTIENCGAYNLTLSATSIMGGILGQADQSTSGANGTRVYNCYSAGYYPLGYNGNIWADYNYSDIAGTKSGIALVDSSAMKGANAITGMKYLDFINTWQTVENGYPIIRAAKNNNLNQEISTSYAIKHSNNGWSIFTTKIDMPKINPTYDDNIAITIDGVKKIVSEAGILISREGFEKADISEVNNTPLTGYKVVGYTNGADNSALVKVGGQIEITAIINGTVDYTARSYIVFNDETVVIGDIIDTELTTDEITVDNGTEIRDVFESGDANFDGVINLKDLVRFKQYAADVQVNKNALFDVIDMDKNNAFGATDISKLRIELLSNIDVSHDSNMELVFEDNFDSYLLDANKWDFNDYMTGYGVVTDVTSDVQSIQREADGNGYLHLTAYKTDDGTYKSVKSISTGDKLTFVHGYLEIRAKVPTVKGAWPSLWLKSNTKNTNLGWKNDFLYNTEVDVFEVMGGNRAISELHKWQYVAETGVTNDYRYSQKFDRNSYAIPDNDWHTYGMLWNDDEIVMYVDDVAIQRYDLNKDFQVKWFWDKGLGMDGFKNQPLCITLNNHLFTPSYVATEAGNWAEDYALDDNFTESVYDIDYVRLYQDKSDANAKLYKAN